ncbi:MAG: YebC/PmpR family DNA-binding transcriptional regulator [Candidatus Sungbacteria bacterium]|nr:YebC/PmpR family DNA-binding transcriptional regulator [Candidatus Sungbacteria bacterium]
MSGHSKWSQIRHKKAITDAKKGNLFSKMVREITIAAKTGSSAIAGKPTTAGDPNPDMNIQLKAAIERAKAVGLPKNNIDRAIAKAGGQGEGADLFEFLYEASAPGGVAILIEGITDNKNRTLNEIKHLLSKHEARLADPGSLLWAFEKIWTANSGHTYKPRSPLTPPEMPLSLKTLLNAISEHDDVQEVYTNIND